MAEEHPSTTINNSTVDETKDRGLFDFLGKKEEEKPKEESIATEFEKVHVSEPSEPKVDKKEEEIKKHSLLDKLRHSDGGSSSSSSDEEVEEGGEKKKKKKEKKKKEEATAAVPPEEKKGFIEKIKEKIPTKKTEEVPPPAALSTPTVTHTTESIEPKEKKGILEKIKEKLPGHHSKTEEEKEKEKI